MAKNHIFSRAANEESRMRTLQNRLKKQQLDQLSKAELIKFINDTEALVRYRAKKQEQALGGFSAALAHRNILNWNKRKTSLNQIEDRTLLVMAERNQKLINSRQLTVAAAKEERHNKLEALRGIGLKRPTTKDISVFWGTLMDLKESGMPYYLQKANGLEVNAMYVLSEVFAEYNKLPTAERDEKILKAMAVSRFSNLQRSMQGVDAEAIKESARKNWERYHRRKLNRELTEDELRNYSTFGVGEAVKQTDLGDYLRDVMDV